MLFSPLFLPPSLAECVGERAWYQAMLEAEAALAWAESQAGVIPDSAAEAIASCCVVDRFEIDTISREARQAGNPVEPLVRALRRLVPEDASQFVHLGATSQDILDTAAVLIAQRTLILIEDELARLAEGLAGLAEEHRHTLMVGRTLLQHALPSTFGLKAAQWLAGVTRARSALLRLQDDVLAVELGGAAGTLASLGPAGVTVLHHFAEQLQLAEPALPWHTERTRMMELGAALSLAAGVLDKIALDIILLAQTDVGEVAEGGDERQGGSSTLPHKRNPVGAVLTRACARRVHANAEILTQAMSQELERAAGAWHSEWQALSEALAGTGGAAAWLREVVDNLEVRPERMRANFDATYGQIMSERIVSLLAPSLGHQQAHDLVRSLSGQATTTREHLTEILRRDPTVGRHLSADDIERAMDPASYLGSADAFIDRALARHHVGTTA